MVMQIGAVTKANPNPNPNSCPVEPQISIGCEPATHCRGLLLGQVSSHSDNRRLAAALTSRMTHRNLCSSSATYYVTNRNPFPKPYS